MIVKTFPKNLIQKYFNSNEILLPHNQAYDSQSNPRGLQFDVFKELAGVCIDFFPKGGYFFHKNAF